MITMKYLAIVLYILLNIYSVHAQSNQDSEIDVTKPTNFYTFLDNNLEFTSNKNANIFGYRANLTVSISPKHLLLIEAPLLYNDKSEKFGLGDIRARYFWLPYKNYDNFFGAFGPSIDIFAPTGNFEKGLGTGRWVVAPGVMGALMLAEWIQLFPVLSYQYVSKSTSDLIPDNIDKETHGMSFQIITPIIISQKVFTQVTPILLYNDFSDNTSLSYVQELLFSYGPKETLWINLFYRGAFKDEAHTIRLGFTMYL